MRITILDVENTVTTKNNKNHLDPFERGNTLVMVGIHSLDTQNTSTYIFDHSDITKDDDLISNQFGVQDHLDKTDLLVGHNIAYDLIWLWESGFKYNKPVFDTMLCEYIFNKGVTSSLGLGSLAVHYKCQALKQNTLKEYFKKGYSTRDIPRNELKIYLIHDLIATKEIFEKQYKRLQNNTLSPTVQLTNEVAVALTKMYQAGFKVDTNKLQEVRKEFEEEKVKLEQDLSEYTKYLMGDTPINLNSPEQLSWILFSRKPKDKKEWATAISNDPYMSNDVFKNFVERGFYKLYKTKAMQCKFCKGKGCIHKVKKDGSPYKNKTKCATCNARGYLYINTKEIAGLRFNPSNVKWASANGFKTNKGNLEILENIASNKNMTKAKTFLSNLKRLSAVSSYLSNYIEGIENFIKPDGLLHVKLNQHITSTGRFSGASPNMQNMPRGTTFPVKKVFVSRFDNGKILEADFAQLEFRVAAYLSQDPVAIKEVTEGFDVHSYTAKVITDAGQPTTRQVAKTHTFAPLYGATGYGRTKAEAAYYTHFLEKYKGIAKWHKQLAKEAMTKKCITTPSGREFIFDKCERKKDGSVTYFTQIKNYPVQSFATADIVPLFLVEITNKLSNKLSLVVNSVHDSVIIDVRHSEVNDIIQIVKEIEGNLVKYMRTRWGVEFNIPLKLDVKIGNDWLNMTEI